MGESATASNTDPMDIATGEPLSLPNDETSQESPLAEEAPAAEIVPVVEITPTPEQAIQLSILKQLQTLTTLMGEVKASVSELKPTPTPTPEAQPEAVPEEKAPPARSRRRSLLRKILM